MAESPAYPHSPLPWLMPLDSQSPSCCGTSADAVPAGSWCQVAGPVRGRSTAGGCRLGVCDSHRAAAMPRTGGRDPDAAMSGDCSSGSTQPPEYNAELELEQLYATLHEYLPLETKFQPELCLPAHPEHGEVSSGARDGAAHVMRCLKMWFDLPPDVFLHAVNLLDRFLTKMKVRPCHVPCISVSCVYIGTVDAGLAVPLEELVSISQSGCTTGDVARMSAVVREKLRAPLAPVTALHWLRLLARLTAWAARSLGVTAPHALFKEGELISQLEMLMCDAACVNIRACELALVLLFNQLESEVTSRQLRQEPVAEELLRLLECSSELQRLCHVSEGSAAETRATVRAVLARYSRGRTEHRQRLVWRLSSRTLKVLRPTERFSSRLPTIEEQNQAAEPAPRARSGSESSDDLNEESKDWPRSPVLPVYCD